MELDSERSLGWHHYLTSYCPISTKWTASLLLKVCDGVCVTECVSKCPAAFVPQHSDFLIAVIWSAMAPARCNLQDARGCVCVKRKKKKKKKSEEERERRRVWQFAASTQLCVLWMCVCVCVQTVQVAIWSKQVCVRAPCVCVSTAPAAFRVATLMSDPLWLLLSIKLFI